MTTALIARDTVLDTLFTADLLCAVCEERPWTQRALTCDALICADCASGEPAWTTDDPHEALAIWEQAPDALAIVADGTAYAVGPFPSVWQEYPSWRQTCPEELGALLAQGQ